MSFAKEIRTQINSIKKTQKITRAMEMVAASKMRKAQDRMELSRPYAREIYRVIGHLAKSNSEYRHPFLIQREVKRVGYIVVTTDRGLCGSLNNALLKLVVSDMKSWNDKGVEQDIGIIGTKGEHFFKRVGGHVIASINHLGDKPQVEDLIGIVEVMLDAFKKGQIDSLSLAYNNFISTMSQKPIIQPILPLPPSTENEIQQQQWDYIYEPEAKYLLDILLSRYIKSQVYQAVVENNASEQAARMVAMKSASDNAGELIDDLQLAYNKARQAAITKELAEIVAGAEAV